MRLVLKEWIQTRTTVNEHAMDADADAGLDKAATPCLYSHTCPCTHAVV